MRVEEAIPGARCSVSKGTKWGKFVQEHMDRDEGNVKTRDEGEAIN